jgi:Transposase DDE domain
MRQHSAAAPRYLISAHRIFVPLRRFTVAARSAWTDAMAQKSRRTVREADLRGLKYFRMLGPLLERLHDDGCARDKVGNRRLHFDQYTSLLLLYFFNPILTSLRGIQQSSILSKVQHLLGCERTSLGSLSAASRVFDPELLRELLGELAQQAVPIVSGREAEALRHLTAVDGTLLPALPKMAWALWLDDQHRAAKMHLHFDVLKGVPLDATVTEGNASEKTDLRQRLQAEHLYVLDRGYGEYHLFQDIIDVGSHFIGRLREDAVWDTFEERSLSPAAQPARVRRDLLVLLGNRNTRHALRQPVRVLEVDTDKSDAHGRPQKLLLVTDRLDLDAELVALAYRYRWAIELFFRWFKCILGCKHLLSTDPDGVAIQIYVGLIASLLISLWTGRKPTKRTFEMLQFYFTGWATLDELMRHLQSLSAAA